MTQIIHEAMTMLPDAHQYYLQCLIERHHDYENALKGIAAHKGDSSESAQRVLDKHGVKWGFGQIAHLVTDSGLPIRAMQASQRS